MTDAPEHELLDVQALAVESATADVSAHTTRRGRRVAAGATLAVGDSGLDAALGMYLKRHKAAVACIKKLKKARALDLASKWLGADDPVLKSTLATIKSMLLASNGLMDILSKSRAY